MSLGVVHSISASVSPTSGLTLASGRPDSLASEVRSPKTGAARDPPNTWDNRLTLPHAAHALGMIRFHVTLQAIQIQD